MSVQTLLNRQPYQRQPVPSSADAALRQMLTVEFQRVQGSYAPSGNMQRVTAAYRVLTSDQVILADASGGAFAVTLPAASAMLGMAPLTIKKVDSSANAVTVTGTVDGAVNPTLATQYKAMTVVSDGTNWWKIGTV